METFFIIILSALSLVTLVAAFLITKGLFPECVVKVQTTLETNWKRSFWIGLLNTILISIFVFGLGSLGSRVSLFYIPTFLVFGAFLIGLLFGLTAFIQILGDRLFLDCGPVKKDIRAGAVFLLASMLPFVGWFLIFPYIISLAFGAVVITQFQRNKSTDNKKGKAKQ
ncbi:MAG: hypothetical protein ACC633_08095 [Anaerolineales bacterium]